MKSIIIYFSQSGNTAKVARSVHKGMGSVLEKCDIFSIDQADPADVTGYDLIGIGSPVWSGVPPHVKGFIDAMPSLPGKHAFIFCTHGAMPIRFMPNMVRLLNKKGLTVIGTRHWFGGVFHPLFPKPYLTDGHPDDIDLKEAEAFGSELPEISRKISEGDSTLIPPIPPLPLRRTMKRIVPEKRLNTGKCTYPSCTLCMDHCRLKVIDLSASPPVFPTKCPLCFFCEMICPEGAIEIDYEKYSKLEVKRARKLFTEILSKAEAEGRFRRHIPESEVGWDTPFYKVFNKHPRVIPGIDDQ
jgi:flavodoxin/ferredoxin